MSGAYLKIENLYKAFGDFFALKDISLEINESEFVCFLGPSGCGKTTLLRAIAGLDIQTSGKVSQGGQDISALPPSERDFGIVFQSYALFPNLTVSKNIAYGLENRKMARVDIDNRVTELLQLVGLPDQGPKYPAQLSGGQQQRVALARAIATNPGLLLLDEPLSALDARVRIHLRREVRRLQSELGVTTVMVTHDQEEALTMADRIVVMDHGVIVQVGTPTEIYERPVSSFVADFIGAMNFLNGTVSDGAVKVGDQVIACDASNFGNGDEVQLAIRPEKVGLGNGGFVATVTESEFLGSSQRLTVTVPSLGNAEITIDLSTAETLSGEFAPGKETAITLPADDILLYPQTANQGG